MNSKITIAVGALCALIIAGCCCSGEKAEAPKTEAPKTEVAKAEVTKSAPLKIGWAINDISTDKPVELAGTYHWRHSKGLRDPLMATALAIDNGEDCVVFLSMDFINPPGHIVRRVRKRVKAEIPDLPPEKIIFHATHIHTGVSIPRTEKKLAEE